MCCSVGRPAYARTPFWRYVCKPCCMTPACLAQQHECRRSILNYVFRTGNASPSQVALHAPCPVLCYVQKPPVPA